MGQRKYKNILKLHRVPDPIEERENLFKEVLKDSTPLPQPVELEDIDIAFKDWVENDLKVVFEDKKIPTVALFSAQRFSEYMDTWADNDDNKNLMMNFKVVTRENNPQPGTLHDKNANVASDATYLMKRVLMTDKNGRPYFMDYRMKQPYCVDLMYTISLVTNKYKLINDFNMMLNKKFKAIQCYIRPNGHFMPMKLEGISDESEYSIDDRQFFSQSFKIRVMAYIIQEDDIVAEEKPILKFVCDEPIDKKNGALVEIEEMDDPCSGSTKDDPYYYQPIALRMVFHECENRVTFKLKTDFDFVTTGFDCSREIREANPFRMKVNDTEVTDLENYKILRGSEISVYDVNKYLPKSEAIITIFGYNPDVVYDEKKNEAEIEMDANTQPCKEIIVSEEEETIDDVKCDVVAEN